jgi:hypothetical protein
MSSDRPQEADPSVRDALREVMAALDKRADLLANGDSYSTAFLNSVLRVERACNDARAALSKQEAATPAIQSEPMRKLLDYCDIADQTGGTLTAHVGKGGLSTGLIRELVGAALKAAQPVPLNVAAQEQRSGLSDARHDSPQANETPPPVAATPAPQEPAEPVAWLLRPIKPRHKPFVRGIYSTKPTAEQYEMAALDGDEYIPLYYTQSVADAQDAGRYRWLKDKSGFDIRSLLDVGDFTSLNAHIDAAMALDVTNRDPKGRPPEDQ